MVTLSLVSHRMHSFSYTLCHSFLPQILFTEWVTLSNTYIYASRTLAQGGDREVDFLYNRMTDFRFNMQRHAHIRESVIRNQVWIIYVLDQSKSNISSTKNFSSLSVSFSFSLSLFYSSSCRPIPQCTAASPISGRLGD